MAENGTNVLEGSIGGWIVVGRFDWERKVKEMGFSMARKTRTSTYEGWLRENRRRLGSTDGRRIVHFKISVISYGTFTTVGNVGSPLSALLDIKMIPNRIEEGLPSVENIVDVPLMEREFE